MAERTKKPQRTRSKRRSQTPHPGSTRASTRGGIVARTSSRNIHDGSLVPGDETSSTPEEMEKERQADERLTGLRTKWEAEKATGHGRVAVEIEARELAVKETTNGKVATSEERDREALDRVLEAAGFATVDQLDADDFALMREAKLEALAQLCEELKMNRGNWKLHPEALARIARQLGATEKQKLEVVQLKIGKPSDRPRRGVTFRAKIGVAAGPAPQSEGEKDVKAAAAALEMEVTTEN